MSRRTALLALLLCCSALGWGAVRWDPALLALPNAPQDGAQVAADSAGAAAGQRAPIEDAARVLRHFLDILDNQRKGWREDLGVDVQILSIDLADRSAEELASELFEARQVGADAPSGGVLILLLPARREARIQVSYSLEGVFPDAILARLAADQLAPYAASGSAGMAVMDVLHLLKDVALKGALEGEFELAERFARRPAVAERLQFLSGGAGATARIPSTEELATRDFKARISEPQRSRYAPSADPLESAEAHLRAQSELAGDPTLELYTPGSRCMRRGYPVAPYEQIQRAQTLERSRPWQLRVTGERAVLSSREPAPGLAPVLLHQSGGVWRVDLVETWKNLFFDGSGSYHLVNSNTPYAAGLAGFGSADSHDVEAWDLGGADLEQVLRELEARGGALAEFLLAEILFRNCFQAMDAIRHYEQALRLAPNAAYFRETLGDRATYLGFDRLALETYAPLPGAIASKLAMQLTQRGQNRHALMFARRALAQNPYQELALRAMRSAARAEGEREAAAQAERELASLESDGKRRGAALQLTFTPENPALELLEPTLVGNVRVYDHAFWSTTLENPSAREVEVLEVRLSTLGTGNKVSGLGDIVDYWNFPSGGHRLRPGEAVRLDKVWGFETDTKHEQLSYRFDFCWQGRGEPKQCGSQRLDLLPR